MLIGGDENSNGVITLGTCFSMFVYIRAHFCFVLIGRNLTAQSTGSHRANIGSGFNFQRHTFKLSFLFPPRRQGALETLLPGYAYWQRPLFLGICLFSYRPRIPGKKGPPPAGNIHPVVKIKKCLISVSFNNVYYLLIQTNQKPVILRKRRQRIKSDANWELFYYK